MLTVQIYYYLTAAIPPLPKKISINGEELFKIMMFRASNPDPLMIEAITILKGLWTLLCCLSTFTDPHAPCPSLSSFSCTQPKDSRSPP